MKEPVLDLRALRAFVTLAQEGSYTRAAQRLNLTQSAVSHAMRNLQEVLGCRVLYKTGRKILLTPQGKSLYQSAERIFNELERITHNLQTLDLQDRGRLKLGCSAAASQFILPPVLREFTECFPGYDIAVQPGDISDVLDQLINNQIDLAITLEPEKTEAYSLRRIFSDQLSFLVSPSHPWARSGKASRREYGDQTYILFQRRSLTFEKIEEFFLTQGMRMNSTIELGSVEAINELVKLGIGVGIAAPWTARRDIEAGAVIPLPMRPRIRRNWSVLWLKQRPLNLAEETFIGLCSEFGASSFPESSEKRRANQS